MGELLPPGSPGRQDRVCKGNPTADSDEFRQKRDEYTFKWKATGFIKLPRGHRNDERGEDQSRPTNPVWADTPNQGGETEASADDTNGDDDEFDPELERRGCSERTVPKPLDHAEVDYRDGNQANQEAHGPRFLIHRGK